MVDLREDVKAAIRDACAPFPFVRRVWLFGSRARGDSGRASDIDLAVEAPGADPGDWARLWVQLTEDLPTLVPVDVLRWEDAPERIRRRILAEGVVIA